MRAELENLDAHVLEGRCPYAPGEGGGEPLRRSFSAATGWLVGFYSNLGPGELTHPGEHVHVHVLIPGPEPFVGHVDSVGARKGAAIRLPVAR